VLVVVWCLRRGKAGGGGGGGDLSTTLLGAEVSVGWVVTRPRRCEAGGGDASTSMLGAEVGGDASASS